MKANMNISAQTKPDITTSRLFTRVCLDSCQKLLAQIRRTKDAILDEFRETRETHEHLLELALSEAEAMAWQTGYPQLVFPTLAREKAEAVVAWESRQQFILHRNPAWLLAA